MRVKTSYIRLLRYVRPYTRRLILGGLCGVLFGGSTAGILPALNKILSMVFTPSNGWVFTVILLAGLLGLGILRSIGQYLSTYLIEWVGNRVVLDLRVEVFSHLQNLPISFFDARKTGEMISRTINDTMMLERAVSAVITDIFREPAVLVFSIAWLFYLDWRLSLYCFVFVPLCIVPVLKLGRKVRKVSMEAQQMMAEMVSSIQESIGGIRIVKAFCIEDREKERFENLCYNFFGKIMKVVRAKSTLASIMVLLAMLAVSIALIFARLTAMKWEAFITFAVGLVVLYTPIKKLSWLHLSIQQSSAAADRIFEILDMHRGDIVEGTRIFDRNFKVIEFKEVSFNYGGRDILKDINFVVKAGEKIAIVGESGAGKTTLISLIPRFFDVTSGYILIDGVDIREFMIKSLRDSIGLVTQDTFLFNDTIANNIKCGMKYIEFDRIVHAAIVARADDFIKNMEDGYDTVVGERGVKLSGGQKQRIAIARALLRDPPILILDEATSALDSESEKQIQDALNEAIRDRTVFIVSHRISTVLGCDRIIVLKNGMVVESGTHEELIRREGEYLKLCQYQSIV